ncbi:MAG: hypothetical protein KDB65_03685 [Calditrichaeota bacterium]|nr:hypothetical protein [Calditrichota bacterium]MCB9368764.1 hypothetical protein [Calditrichota bacterium]
MKSPISHLIRSLVIAANILFILWILFNGMNENWSGTPVEKVSYSSLVVLLILNAYLLSRRRRSE